MGARGNSGVIISQMLRGFAHHVRNRTTIDTFVLATGMREAAAAARQALVRPVEGTIVIGRRCGRRRGLQAGDQGTRFLSVRRGRAAGRKRGARSHARAAAGAQRSRRRRCGRRRLRLFSRGHSALSSGQKSARDRFSAPAVRARASSRRDRSSARINSAPSSCWKTRARALPTCAACSSRAANRCSSSARSRRSKCTSTPTIPSASKRSPRSTAT